MFKNELTHNGIHYSRYIASWRRMGGKIYRGGLFERWLKEREGLTNEEISDILILAENGKLELENSAKSFMEENMENFRFERKVALMGGCFEDSQGTHFERMKKKFEMATKEYK